MTTVAARLEAHLLGIGLHLPAAVRTNGGKLSRHESKSPSVRQKRATARRLSRVRHASGQLLNFEVQLIMPAKSKRRIIFEDELSAASGELVRARKVERQDAWAKLRWASFIGRHADGAIAARGAGMKRKA